MNSIMNLIENFPCGLNHETAIKDIHIGSGFVSRVGKILKTNGFPKKLLLLADKNTLKVSNGIEKSLKDLK